MVGLRRQTEGLAKEQENGALFILRTIFSLVVSLVAIAGLVGIVIFSIVHWASFS